MPPNPQLLATLSPTRRTFHKTKSTTITASHNRTTVFASISPSSSNEAMVVDIDSPQSAGTGIEGIKSSFSRHNRSADGDDPEDCNAAAEIYPTDRDVLCGRGMGIRRHPGNVLYNKLLRAYYEAYKLAPKGSKAGIVKEIVVFVREGQPAGRGRFLECSKGIYIDIGHERAMNKTAQAFRDIKVTPEKDRSPSSRPKSSIHNHHSQNQTASDSSVSNNNDDDPGSRGSPARRRPSFRERLAMLRRESRSVARNGGDSGSDDGSDDHSNNNSDDDDDDDNATNNDDGEISDTETEESFPMYESPTKR